ncbi:hypothetical protein [Bradyrhizobium sp. BR 1433]|uniref:hypothetical protein n=1 Tax=Bradyrhizobium sp. BR 1433 TaxID=3447967 RepID=UPI003EE60C7A
MIDTLRIDTRIARRELRAGRLHAGNSPAGDRTPSGFLDVIKIISVRRVARYPRAGARAPPINRKDQPI